MINENKKLVLVVIIFILTVLLNEFLYRQLLIIRKNEVAQEANNSIETNNEKILSYSGPIIIKNGSILLTTWDTDSLKTVIYSYDFQNEVKSLIDWSFGYRKIKFENDRLIYKTDYNQFSVLYFRSGDKEIINLPDVHKNVGWARGGEIKAFLLSGDHMFYIYFPCDDNNRDCIYSIRDFNKLTGETKIISNNIESILPHGGIELGFSIDKYDEKNNQLYFGFNGGDACASFGDKYSVNLKTGKFILVNTTIDSGCLNGTVKTLELTKVEPTKTEKEERLESEDTCGDLKIFDYGNSYPFEIHRDDEIHFINENSYKISWEPKIDYDFVGCVKY